MWRFEGNETNGSCHFYCMMSLCDCYLKGKMPVICVVRMVVSLEIPGSIWDISP